MRRANDIERSTPGSTRLIGMDRQHSLAYQKSEAGSRNLGDYVRKLSPLGVRGSVGYMKPEERPWRALGFAGEAQSTPGTVDFSRGIEEIADGAVNLANGSKKMANETVKTAGGAKNIANGRAKAANWDGKTAERRGTLAGGLIPMRVSENNDLMMTPEMEYGHFSSLLGELVPIYREVLPKKSGGRWCLNTIYSPPHRCKRGTPLLNPLCQLSLNPYADISPKWGKQSGRFDLIEEKLKLVASSLLPSRRVHEERSVTAEQEGNRFLSVSRRIGMTDELAAWNLQPGTTLLTIKYNNSPSRRTAGTTKNAHLSRLKKVGTGDNKLNPFFLILKHAKNCEQFSPLGEMPAGQRGGTVANINKTSAYET